MRRFWGLIVVMGAACSTLAASTADLPQRPGGSIPELTRLFQTVDASTRGLTSFVSHLDSAACAGIGPVFGPDLVYTWVAQTDNPDFPLHLDFRVTPEAGFDPVVYALSELDDGTRCIAAVDGAGAGGAEELHVEEQLTPGQRYYLYIDSRNPAASAGDFRLLVSTFVSVELQSYSIE